MASVLIVEDDPDCAALLETHLKKHRHSVSAARSGAQALEHILLHKPDLAIVDLRLPGVDGVRLVEILRADHMTERLPILLMSAYEKGWVAHRLPDDPLVRFLEKPLDFGRLDRALADLLAAA